MADITSMQAHTAIPMGATAGRSALNAVYCLLIPIRATNLLVPSAAVAEIVAYAAPERLPDAPDWLLGRLDWRDRRVPLISFEAAAGASAASPGPGSRVAVFNTLNGNPRLPYIAVLTQGIPQLRLANETTVEETEDAAAPPPAIAARAVRVQGQPALIPDIDELEQRLERLRIFAR